MRRARTFVAHEAITGAMLLFPSSLSALNPANAALLDATLLENAAAFLSAHGLPVTAATPSEIAAHLVDPRKFLHRIAKPGENRAEAALRFRDALHGVKPELIDLRRVHLLLAGQKVYHSASDPIEEAVRVLAEGLRLAVMPPERRRRVNPPSADQWVQDVRGAEPLTAHGVKLALRRLPRIQHAQRRAELWKILFETILPLNAHHRMLGRAIPEALERSELGVHSLEVLESFYAAIPAAIPLHKRVRHLALLANAAGCMGFPAVADRVLTEAVDSLESAMAGLGRPSRHTSALFWDVVESIGRIGVTSLMVGQFARLVNQHGASADLVQRMVKAGLGRAGLPLYRRIEEIARQRNGEAQWPLLTALIKPIARLDLGKAGEDVIKRLLKDSAVSAGMPTNPLVRRKSQEHWDRELAGLQFALKSAPGGVLPLIEAERRKVKEDIRPRLFKGKALQKKPDESKVGKLLSRVPAVERLKREERLREYEVILVEAVKSGLGPATARVFKAVNDAASQELAHEEWGYLLELMARLYASVAWGAEAEKMADFLISFSRPLGPNYRLFRQPIDKVLVSIAEALPSAGLAEEAAIGLYERIISLGTLYGESDKAVLGSLRRSGLGRRIIPLLHSLWRRSTGWGMRLASQILDAADELNLEPEIFPLYRDVAGFRGEVHSPLSVSFKSTQRTVENLVRVLRAVEANGSEEALDITRQCREMLSSMGMVTLFESIADESFPEALAAELFPLVLMLFEKAMNASVQPPYVVETLEKALGRSWPPELARRGREILDHARNDSEWEKERAARFARIQPKLHTDAIAPAVEGLLRFVSLKAGSENKMLEEAARKIANANPMEAGRWLPGVAKKWISDPLRRDEFLATVALGLPMNFNMLLKQMETALALAEAIEGAATRDKVLERAASLLNDWKSRHKNTESPMTRELLKRAEVLDARITKLKLA